MFWWTLTPNSICRACSAAGFTPRNVASTADASFPGITLGMMKFTVSAAQRVTAKRPARRLMYLIAAPTAPDPSACDLLAHGIEMCEHDAVVWCCPHRGLRVRVLRRRPAPE